MHISNLRQPPSAASLQRLELSSLQRGGGLQRDGIQGGGQLQQLLEGAKALLKSIHTLQQQVQGAQPGGMQRGSCSPAPFSDSSFTPASASRPPVELNPAAKSGPSAASPSAVSPSAASPSGDARLGPGLPPALEKHKGAIESAAAKTGVPASMLAAQIWQESRGNLDATSVNGGNGLTDTGLMQVNPNTFQELQAKHPELQGKNLADPETNILAGAYYMKDMKEQFGNWDLALRAYNSGPNGVDRGNPNAIPAGTGDATYVQKVKQFWDTIATGQGTLPA